MVLPQSGYQRQGRERVKANGQAWRGIRREEALPLLQLTLDLLGQLSPCQTGWKQPLLLILQRFGLVIYFSCSPSPLVQLAESPDEVVVSKD